MIDHEATLSFRLECMISQSPPQNKSSLLMLRVPPMALFAVFAVAMWFLPGTLPIGFTASWMVALMLAAVGGAFCLAGVRAFQHARTTVNPITPAASTALVASGIYRVTRNPMYLGFALLLLALAMYLGKLSGLLLVPLFMAYLQHFQIRPEERALQAKFGVLFVTYCRQVRRWL